MVALAPARSKGREVVAEALGRLRADLERSTRRRFPSVDAQDVVQRASVRALERAADVRDVARVDGWVRRIVVRTALDLVRVARREVPLEGHDIEAPTAEAEPCACGFDLMHTLPTSYQDILRRVDVDGAGLGEVAETLEIAPNNAAVRLHRARRALKERLQSHCGVQTFHECQSCVCDEHTGCGASR